ncbi:hypothetical protein GGX14DRAFT_366727 [Mycena pura]|uniref:F-box domain-containing protein n=1 Tax=Mycena pura TaxID=153505 RepID=A0AAD6VC54_9AGAR|nr:hypothetical protein GGX14DRAFT_366727 [Mycena pura]
MGQAASTTPLPLEITSRLAPELYDHFLDEFHASNSTLSTCSLVCKAWLHLCRRHLFFSVNLRPSFVQFLRDSPHAMATVYPYIRNVGLGGGWMREQQHEFNDIILFMITLENVRNMHLETWSWTYLAPPASAALLRGRGNLFQTLTVLDLKFIHFISFSTLRTFLSQFPALREILFDNVTWDTTHDDSDSGPDNSQLERPSFLTRFEKLTISACSNAPILTWLSNAVAEDGTAIVPPIRFIRLPEILPHEAPLVGKFLSSLGASLEHLEIGFLAHNYDEDVPAIRAIDLSLHPRLRTVRVHQLTLYQFPATPPTPTSSPPLAEVSPCFWLVPLLARINSPALSHLAFNIWLGEERQLNLIDWHALVRVLSDPRFGSLRVLQFHVRGIEEAMDDEVRNWISHRLHDWDAVQERLNVSFE